MILAVASGVGCVCKVRSEATIWIRSALVLARRRASRETVLPYRRTNHRERPAASSSMATPATMAATRNRLSATARTSSAASAPSIIRMKLLAAVWVAA